MEGIDYFIIALAAVAALALVVYLIFRNRSDRKKFITPSETDPVEEARRDNERDRDRL